MIKFLIRGFLFFAGLGMLADVGLPMREETLTVEKHTRSTTRRDNSPDTEYTLHLSGGHVTSCEVGHTAYTSLKDGVAVGVRATRIFKHCVQVTSAGVSIYQQRYWRLIGIVGGLFMIVMAFNWGKNEDDDAASLFAGR